MFKIEFVLSGEWRPVLGKMTPDGKPLEFASRDAAVSEMAAMFPALKWSERFGAEAVVRVVPL